MNQKVLNISLPKERALWQLKKFKFLENIVDYDFVFVYFGSDKVDFVKVLESMKSLLLSFRKKVLS